MSIKDIISIAAAIVTSLGGGALIITAVAKWCGDLLAQKMLLSIKSEHEKEIEQYKTTLQDMSVKFKLLVGHSVEVASKQYDMEVEIYKNIWKSLYELYTCINYISDFENPIGSDPEKYKEQLNKNCNDFECKMTSFQQQIDSVAPFYQGNVYGLLCQLDEKCKELLTIFKCSVDVSGMSSENRDRVNSDIKPKMIEIKEELTGMIREHLHSLRMIPDNEENFMQL